MSALLTIQPVLDKIIALWAPFTIPMTGITKSNAISTHSTSVGKMVTPEKCKERDFSIIGGPNKLAELTALRPNASICLRTPTVAKTARHKDLKKINEIVL